MIMITGGAFQGKREFAKQKFGLSDSDILSGKDCDISELSAARCVANYELVVKRLTAKNIDAIAFTKSLETEIVIINEIGCGIIPLEKSERQWRETVGRAGCILAKKAETVYRLCCGIPIIIC